MADCRISILRCVATLAVLSLGTPINAAVEDTQQWSIVSIGKTIGPRSTIIAEVQGRLVDHVDRLGTTVERATFAYRLDPHWTLAAGYSHIATLRAGKSASYENNVFQQVLWTTTFGRHASLKVRSYLEERQVSGAQETGLRYRQRERFEWRLGKNRPTLVGSTELMLNLNTTDWGAHYGFDQIRNFVGVNVALAPQLTLETGYLNRYQRRDGQPDRDDHVIPVSLALRF